MNEGKYAVNPSIVGHSAMEIAKLAGISVPKGTKMLIAELEGVGQIIRYQEKNFLQFLP